MTSHPDVDQTLAPRTRSRPALWLLFVGLAAPFISLVAWLHLPGPYMDTAIEFQRLQQGVTLEEFLRSLAADNQPPLGMLLTWCAYRLTEFSISPLRGLLGVVTVCIALSIAAWALHSPSWLGSLRNRMKAGSNAWCYALGTFGVFVALSPAVMPVFLLLRYSMWMSLIWFATLILLLRFSSEPSARQVVLISLISGLGILVSFTSVALIVTVIAVIAVREARRLPLLLTSWVPAILLLVLWVAYAGDGFLGRATGRATSSWSERLTAAYENVAWLVVGPASLPIWSTVAVLACGWLIIVALGSRAPRWTRLSVALSTVIAVLAFSFSGLVNGNMGGPTLVVLLLLAGLTQARGFGRVQSGLMVGLAAVLICATVFIWNNWGVLRPFGWSNAAPSAVSEVLRLRASEESVVVDFGDVVTHSLLEQASVTDVLDPSELLSRLPALGRLVVLRGDERPKDEQWREISGWLHTEGFVCAAYTSVGRYDNSDMREALGMYNTSTPQYRIYVYVRPGLFQEDVSLSECSG